MGDVETWPQLQRRQWAEKRRLIECAVRACRGNRTRAARLIDMNRGALQRFIRTQGLGPLIPDPQGKEKRDG